MQTIIFYYWKKFKNNESAQLWAGLIIYSLYFMSIFIENRGAEKNLIGDGNLSAFHLSADMTSKDDSTIRSTEVCNVFAMLPAAQAHNVCVIGSAAAWVEWWDLTILKNIHFVISTVILKYDMES